jgi:hypothetical protein
MSGGAFEYRQYQLLALEEELDSGMTQYRQEEPDTILKEVEEEFLEAKKALQRAYIYLKRFDWLFSADDGQETFLKRLKEDLEEVG